MRVGPPDCRRTLLALHGGPGLSHGSLRPLDALAGPDRCIVYFDQRGNGLSEAPSAPWTTEGLVGDVDAVREAWGVKRVDLIGHSWGAYLAIAYAVSHRRQVRKLVLSSPAPLTPSGWTAFEKAMRDRIRSLRRAGLIPKPIPTEGDDCARSSGDVQPAYLYDPSLPIERGEPLTCSRSTYRNTWAALPIEDLAAVARSSRKRATWIQGEGETRRDPIREEWLRYHRGRLKVVEVSACGHLLHTECPETWIDRVSEAL